MKNVFYVVKYSDKYYFTIDNFVDDIQEALLYKRTAAFNIRRKIIKELNVDKKKIQVIPVLLKDFTVTQLKSIRK